jgi:pimeloyl-ACP methyl ester carboxylesterase
MIQDFGISGLVDLASSQYRVIVFDRPGYGYSDRPRHQVWTPKAQAELLHNAFRRLDIQRPIVLGHSWGTLVALALGLEYPEDVGALVLLSGYYYPTFRLDVPLVSPPAIPILGDVIRYTVSPWLGRLAWPGIIRRLFNPADVPSEFAQFPTWMALRPSQLRAGAEESALMIPSANMFRHRYRELAMPVMIMAGEDDRHVNAHRHSERLHDDLPQSELRLVPGVGHMVHHVVPREVMAAIDAAAKVAKAA